LDLSDNGVPINFSSFRGDARDILFVVMDDYFSDDALLQGIIISAIVLQEKRYILIIVKQQSRSIHKMEN